MKISNYIHVVFLLLLGWMGLQKVNAQPFGSAIVLNGASNYVNVPHNAVLNDTTNVTIEAWIQPCKTSGNNVILSKYWCTGAQNAYYLTILNGKLRWYWSVNGCSGSANIYESTFPVVQLNTWQHIAVVHTPTSVTLYINGSPITASLVQGSYSSLKTSSEPFRIGALRDVSGSMINHYTGMIDETRLWNTALTSTQINARMNAPLIGNEANLVAYYNMNVTGVGNGLTIPNGCIATGTTLNGTTIGNTITPNFTAGLSPSFFGNDTTICQGDTLILDATFPIANYIWQDGSNSPTYTVTQPDTYSVQVAFMSNCFYKDTIVVDVTPSPVVNLGNDTSLCNGDTLILDATDTNVTYLWSNGTTDSTLAVTTTGNYHVEVTRGSCSTSDTINVTFTPGPPVNLGNDTLLCNTSNLLLDATTPNATYTWQDNSTNPTFNVTTTGNYWVAVDVNGCVGSDTILVVVNPQALSLGNDSTLCPGDSLILDAFTPNSTYLWQNNSTDSVFTVSQGGTYWVTQTNACGVFTDTIVIDYTPILPVNLGNDTTLCFGQTFTLDASQAGATYIWQDFSNSSTMLVNQTALYWVQVFIGNCMESDSVQVTFNGNLPVVNLGPDTSFCAGDSIGLDISSVPGTYLWNTGTTVGSIYAGVTGKYWVAVTNNCGTTTDTINIERVEYPVIDLGSDTALCEGNTLLLSANTQNATYLWHNGTTNATLTGRNPGIYWVEVDVKGCKSSDTLQILPGVRNVRLGIDTTVCIGEHVYLDATSPITASYVWSTGETGSKIGIDFSETVWVQVTNACGTSSDTISIVVEDCECRFYIPNAFTPDGDEVNDYFMPESVCDMTDYDFRVYDRWGVLVFQSNTMGEGWDGYYNGQIAEGAIYAYSVRYIFKDEWYVHHGKVNLIR